MAIISFGVEFVDGVELDHRVARSQILKALLAFTGGGGGGMKAMLHHLFRPLHLPYK
jgi:hypothetical protein